MRPLNLYVSLDAIHNYKIKKFLYILLFTSNSYRTKIICQSNWALLHSKCISPSSINLIMILFLFQRIDGWALIRGVGAYSMGCYLIILCLGWVLIQGGNLFEGRLNQGIIVPKFILLARCARFFCYFKRQACTITDFVHLGKT